MKRYQRTVKHQSSNYRKNNISIKKTHKSRKTGINRYIMISVSCLIMIGFAYQLLKIKQFKLEQPNLAITETDLNKLIDQNYNFINGNILTFSCLKLSNLLNTKYPIYSNAECKKDYKKQTITISLKENPTELIWTSGGQSFGLDSNGRAIGQVQTKTELNNIVEVFDKTNLPITTGQKVTTDQFISFVQKLYQADQTQIDFINFEKYNIEESIEELIIETDQGIEIRFNSSRSAEVQIENLLKVLRERPITQIKQYIDLRIPNRVYYY
ncbi:hypothetical protein H6792_02960 [Candidatus Nomurabacteria bacterium]|nr:hypothetical protein [Candidatus Nomurabacteria bacterium]